MAEVPNLVISVDPISGGEVAVSYNDLNESLDDSEAGQPLDTSLEDSSGLDDHPVQIPVNIMVDIEKPSSSGKRYLNPELQSDSIDSEESATKPAGFHPMYSEDTIRMLYLEYGIDHESYRDKMRYRLNCVHVRGVNHMSTEDVFDYFNAYRPTEVEWVSDYSCNVVWPDNQSAASAMLSMSKLMQALPLNRRTDDDDDPNHIPVADSVRQTDGGETMVDEDGGALGSGDDENISPLKRAKTTKNPPDLESISAIESDDFEDAAPPAQNKDTIPTDPVQDDNACKRISIDQLEDEEMGNDDESTAVELRYVDPSKHAVPPGVWRVGDAYSKSPLLLFRFATRDDVKLPGAHSRSDYYKKHGNPNLGNMKGLISQSRKRKIMQSKHDSNQIITTFLEEDHSMDSDGEDSVQGEVEEKVPVDLRARLSAKRNRPPGGVHDRLGPKIVPNDDTNSDGDDQSVVVGYEDEEGGEESYVVESEDEGGGEQQSGTDDSGSSDSEFDIDKYMPDESNVQMTMHADKEQLEAAERPHAVSAPKYRPPPSLKPSLADRLQRRGSPPTSQRKRMPPRDGDLRQTLTKWREEDDDTRWGNREVYDIR